MQLRNLVILQVLASIIIEGVVLYSGLDKVKFGGEYFIPWRVLHLLQSSTAVLMSKKALDEVDRDLTKFKQQEGESTKKGSNSIGQSSFSGKRFLEKEAAHLFYRGMRCAFIGDVINSFLLDSILRKIIHPSTMLSIVPFAAMHIYYIRAFQVLRAAGSSNSTESQKKKHKMFLNLLWFAAAALLHYKLVLKGVPILDFFEKTPWRFFATVGYALMVTRMAIDSCFPPKNAILAAGGVLFLFSDAIFGYTLSDGPQRAPVWSFMIWITYFCAQLLITQGLRVRALEWSSDIRSFDLAKKHAE